METLKLAVFFLRNNIQIDMLFHQSNFKKSLVLLASVGSLLAGCAPVQNAALSTPSTPLEQGPLVAWAAEHAAGSRAELNDPRFGGRITVRLDQEYLAASGLTCKRIYVGTERPFGDDVVVCRAGEDSWFLAPDIRGRRGIQEGI